ncbi:MAG: alpha/beta hydrolase [Sphingomonadales bacterium]|nr:alpha/beta hydrolase [Sphingomonadales bacterium]MDE2170287.1 alpha/beta hydrolase [Sphingomonadales bacterium]
MKASIVRWPLAAMALAVALVSPAQAQNDKMVQIAAPAQPDAIVLGTGPLPGAKASEVWHRQYGSTFARNVTVATLTPFLPDPAKATGTAVIVAPGGGFTTLSMENEGWDVAKALAARGVAAFVLKYRLHQTPSDITAYQDEERARFSKGLPPPTGAPARSDYGPQIADARAAFALVRKRAGDWHIDPARVGMVGFSAGAMLTLSTTLDGVDARPAFIGTIYGPQGAVKVPADAPPLFVALAMDDPLFGHGGYGLVESWRSAKRPVEFHFFEQGGHGFGMYPKTTTSTGWFEEFARWMAMHGWMKPAS